MIKSPALLSTKKNKMVNYTPLIQQDLKHVWHPCTQMKDFEQHPPLVIKRAKGSYLYTNQGPVIDAISSWWCKSLGHGHPAVLAAMKKQLSRFEHVIGANTTNPQIVALSETLAEKSGLQHVFFASDGSSAVEIAMKLALHASKIQGHTTRNRFMALKQSYHGETLGTLCVSDLGLYKEPYAAYQIPCHFIDPIPYVTGPSDPLWNNADLAWKAIEPQLIAAKKDVCALLIEPIVQGAGGMRCYSADFLNRLVRFAKANNIYVIADEIMTGIGRTGTFLASEHAHIQPDMICLSKGLTSGAMPLSAVLIDHPIYDLFYGDTTQGNAFLHSHTYSGNPLAVSAALATLHTIDSEGILEQANALGDDMKRQFTAIAEHTGKLSNIRSIGAIVAGDLAPHHSPRLGYRLQQDALKRGALLRPLGQTLYWLPPLTTDHKTIEKLSEITLHSIMAVYS